jgi:archaellum component FlaC
MDGSFRSVKADSGGHLRHTDLEKVYDRLNSVDGKLNQLCGEFRAHSDSLRTIFNKIAEKGIQ